MIGGDVLFESGEKAITVLGDRAEQTHPVALAREFNSRPRSEGKSCGTGLDPHGFLGLIDTDYCSVHLPLLF